MLTIDHVNGDGAAHRKEASMSTSLKLHQWLKRNNYPDGYRVLCFNCNIAAFRNGNVCPHQC